MWPLFGVCGVSGVALCCRKWCGVNERSRSCSSESTLGDSGNGGKVLSSDEDGRAEMSSDGRSRLDILVGGRLKGLIL